VAAQQVRSKDLGFDAWTILDACRNDNRARVPIKCADWSSCCNQYTLPDFSNQIQNLPFFDDIAEVRDPTIAMLSKVLNCACHSRKYGTSAENGMFESPDDTEMYEALLEQSQAENQTRQARARDRKHFIERYRNITSRRDQFKLIILCSLLGNYRHVRAEDRLLDEDARFALYNELQGPLEDGVFRSRPEDDAWLQSILHQAPMLMIWCIREYLVFALLNDPALLDSVRDTMQFDVFRSITARAMATIRHYLAHHLVMKQANACQALEQTATQPLCRCINKIKNVRKGQAKRKRSPCRYQQHTWLHDINVLLLPFKAEMLRITYRKHDIGILPFLRGTSVRVRAPLIPRQLNHQEKAARHKDQEDLEQARLQHQRQQDNEQMCQSMQEVLPVAAAAAAAEATQAFFSSRVENKQDAAVQHASDLAATDKARQAKATTINQADVFHFISPAQFAFLSQLCSESIRNGRVASLVQMVQSFTHCAKIPTAVVDSILTFIDMYQCGGMTKRALLEWIVQFAHSQPHAYNLIQVSAEMIKMEALRQTSTVGVMPTHVLRRQIARCQVKTLDSLQADDIHQLGVCEERINYFTRSLDRETKESTRDLLVHTIQELESIREVILERLKRVQLEWTRASQPVEPSFVNLHTCDVCNEVASNVRGPHPDKKYYRWGLDSVKLNFTTNQLHCHRARMNHKGRCFDKPLIPTNLLGIRHMHGKKAYQLCVQCADIMIPDSTTCTSTRDGLLCSMCSLDRFKIRVKQQPDLDQWSKRLHRVCLICNQRTRTKRNTFLYPFDLVCCHRHHRRFMIHSAHAAMLLPHINSRESMAQHLIDAHVGRKEARAKYVQPGNTRRMKLARQRDRARTRR
jgi:hypothetical protein